MQTLQEALADFGHDMGMNGRLSPGEGGGTQLRFESGAVLGVAPQGEHVVVHLWEPVRHDAARLLLRAMKLAGSAESAEAAVQPGLRSTADGDWLVLGTRFPMAECSARRLHAAAARLREAFERVGSA
jgi:type III secretion system chaperone SycN